MDLFGYRRIWFDIGTANESLPPIILSAGDHDGRIIAVRLWDGASSVSGTGLIARLLFNDNQGGSGGYVEMTAIAGEATAAWEVAAPSEALRPGRSTLCIEISQGTTIVCSRLIEALVEPSVIDDSSQEAQDALAEFRAAVARLEDFTVPVVVGKGGTGKTSHTANAVLTGNGTGNVKNVATANGALFATMTNGAASFGTLPIAQGGTGATTVAAARAGLGLGNTDGALPIANGGTGSTDAASARTALGITPANIGAVAKSGDTMTGHLVMDGREVQPKSANLTDGTSANASGSGAVDFIDSAGTIIGMMRPVYDSNGQWLTIFPRRTVNSAGKTNELRLGVDSNGAALVAFAGTATGQQAAWLAALGLPSGINAATWLAALGIATTPTKTTNVVTVPETETRFEVTSSSVWVLNGIASIMVNFKAKTALTAFQRYAAIATIAEGYRPCDEHLCGGILPTGAAIGNVSASGAISFYPLQAVAANTAINIRATYIMG